MLLRHATRAAPRCRAVLLRSLSSAPPTSAVRLEDDGEVAGVKVLTDGRLRSRPGG